MQESELNENVTPSTEEIVTQDNQDSQVSTPEIEKEGSKEAAPTSDSEKQDDKTEESSEGFANLRNHVKELESDINNQYKPWFEEAEKRGGVELAKEGLGFLDPLMLDDDNASAEKFLDHLYNLSDTKYSAIVTRVLNDHGPQWLKQQGIVQDQNTIAESDFEKELDPNDPIKQVIADLRDRLNELENKGAAKEQSQTNEQIEAQAQARGEQFMSERYEPIRAALDALNLGEDTELYKQSIQATVERLFTSDQEAYGKFQTAYNMAIKGQGKLAAGHIAEVDRKLKELTAKAIQIVTGGITKAPAAVKETIAEKKTTLPKADSLGVATAARETGVPSDSAKAFDKDSMHAKLKELEAAGRF